MKESRELIFTQILDKITAQTNNPTQQKSRVSKRRAKPV